jgi:hypothetical protein
MNFFRKAYFDAGGDYWTWRAAVRGCPAFVAEEGSKPAAGVIPAGYR